jgi:hypothetical protein
MRSYGSILGKKIFHQPKVVVVRRALMGALSTSEDLEALVTCTADFDFLHPLRE